MHLAYTYDLSTSIGKVRLNCQDTSEANAIFDDAEIQAFLDQNAANIFLAAADALDIIASNQSYILKAISNNGLTTNGPAVAADLRAHAKVLRAKVASNIGTTSTGVAIVTNPDDPFLAFR